ncbi:unnamed protein product [marine sediment metagenome]|uniref:FAD-dependent oxidoreductase 2 FAD binding domain-containing protein n=1 Tax=marine sediment metagenome TaxID=412755 RepID=X0X3B8_9ZZZZ
MNDPQAIEEVDLLIAGAGIGGSVAAKFAAMGGLDVLLIEKCKTPRHKPCSGIQFPYFERAKSAVTRCAFH